MGKRVDSESGVTRTKRAQGRTRRRPGRLWIKIAGVGAIIVIVGLAFLAQRNASDPGQIEARTAESPLLSVDDTKQRLTEEGSPAQIPAEQREDVSALVPTQQQKVVDPKLLGNDDSQSSDLIVFETGKRVNEILISDGFSPLRIPKSKPLVAESGTEFYVVKCKINTLEWPSEKIDFLRKEGTNIQSSDIVLETKDGRRIHPSYASYITALGSERRVFAPGPLRNIAVLFYQGKVSGEAKQMASIYIARSGPEDGQVEAEQGGAIDPNRKALPLWFAFSLRLSSEVERVFVDTTVPDKKIKPGPTAIVKPKIPRIDIPKITIPPPKITIPPINIGDSLSPRSKTSGQGSALSRNATLPEDFEFAALTEVVGRVDLRKIVKTGTVFSINGDQLKLARQRDAVQALHGEGLHVTQQIDGNVLSGNYKIRFFWTPETFACYRDEELIGLWDPKTDAFRPASNREAPKEFSPEFTGQQATKPKQIQQRSKKVQPPLILSARQTIPSEQVILLKGNINRRSEASVSAIRVIRGRGDQDSWKFEIRPKGGKQLRVRLVDSMITGSIDYAFMDQSMIKVLWQEQPYEILDRDGVVVFSHPILENLGEKRPPIALPERQTLKERIPLQEKSRIPDLFDSRDRSGSRSRPRRSRPSLRNRPEETLPPAARIRPERNKAAIGSTEKSIARKWTNNTGKYRVVAELIGFTDGEVRLRKANGQVITVPLAKLSSTDKEYVRERSRQQREPEKLRPDIVFLRSSVIPEVVKKGTALRSDKTIRPRKGHAFWVVTFSVPAVLEDVDLDAKKLKIVTERGKVPAIGWEHTTSSKSDKFYMDMSASGSKIQNQDGKVLEKAYLYILFEIPLHPTPKQLNWKQSVAPILHHLSR